MKHDEASTPVKRQEIIVCQIRHFEKKNDLLPPPRLVPHLLCCFFNSRPRKKGEWGIAFVAGASLPVRSGLRRPAGIVIVGRPRRGRRPRSKCRPRTASIEGTALGTAEYTPIACGSSMDPRGGVRRWGEDLASAELLI